MQYQINLISSILFLILFLSPFLSQTATASHGISANISYEDLGNNEYLLHLNFYRDCSGIGAPNTDEIELTSSCGTNFSVPIYRDAVSQNVPMYCESQASNSSCINGSEYGVLEYVYSSEVVQLDPACEEWTLSYGLCCRSPFITNSVTPDEYNLFATTKLFNISEVSNDPHRIFASPIINACVGQAMSYNLRGFDNDGDSLVHSLVNPLSELTVPVPYTSGFSSDYPVSTSPPNTFELDPQTGVLSFTADNIQIGIVGILTEEYRDGEKIGETRRELTIRVTNCGSSTPTLSAPFNVTGGSFDGKNFEICLGESLTFDLAIADSGNIDSFLVSTTLPNATLSYAAGNPTTVNFQWTATTSFIGNQGFELIASNDICPIPGKGSEVYGLRVIGVGISVPYTDTASCLGCPFVIPITTNVSGMGSFSWSPTTGLDDPNIATPTATVFAPTTYTVTYTEGDCVAQGEITVPLFAPPVCELSTDSCLAPMQEIAVGTDSTFTSGNLSPHGGYQGSFEDSRDQSLFKVDELLAAGLQEGFITEISYNVAIDTSTLPYNDFTIKIGCTQENYLKKFVPGLEVVFSDTITVVEGWNTHVFDQPFYWTGTDNIIVETCYDNDDYSRSDHLYYSTTDFFSQFSRSTDDDVGCSLSSGFPRTGRANVKFGNCQQFDFNIAKEAGVYQATKELEEDGWTHYIDDRGTVNDLSDDLLLLSIRKGNSGTVLFPEQVTIGILDGPQAVDLSAAAYVDGSRPWYVMNRYWDVAPTTQPNLEGVDVRFYYEAQDYWEIRQPANALTTEINDLNDLTFFKFESSSNVNPDPSMGHQGGTVDNFIELDFSSYLLKETDYIAEFHVSSFSGGSGGGFGSFTVGIIDPQSEEELHISPNPAVNHLFFSFKGDWQGKATLQLFDTQGQLVHEGLIDLESDYNRLKLPPSLSAGMYFLSISTGDGVATGRFVKGF